MIDFGAFHLLRPHWLWALVPIAVIALLLARQGSAAARWRGVVAPHLLEHLIVLAPTAGGKTDGSAGSLIGESISLEELERAHIEAILSRENWHQGRAATTLGISAKTLYRKIRTYGLERP